MGPFFTIDKRTTRRTTRRWSDPVRDLTRPVHGTGSDRPELIQSIGRFNKAESKAFEDFLDSRKANSGDDGWDLHKVEVEFLSYFKTTFPANTRLPLIERRSMAALLRARAKQKVRRGTASRFVKKGKKWVIRPPQSYAEDTTLPAGMMLVNRKVHADLVAKAATASSTSRPAPPSRPSLAPARTATESELMSTAAEPTSHAKIVADAMIPVDDVSVWKAQVEFPFSAKLAVVEALAGDSGISQRQFQDTFCSLAMAFLDHQEQALGKVLIDPSTPASVLQALASMPKDALDNIRNALDAVVECPPTESQFAEIKAARESNISAAIAAAAPSKGSLTNWTIEVGEIADLQRHQESNREGGCIVADAGSDQEQKVLHCTSIGTPTRE